MARDEAYRRAEKKIEAALRSGATELKLNGMELTELPESLGQLTKLQELNLAGSDLTSLPEWLGNLTQLQSLDISSNDLTSLPEWLGNLTQLKVLNLEESRLTALPETLGNLTNLRIVDSGTIGNVEQRVLAVSLVQDPQHRHLPLDTFVVAAHRFVQAATTELWLTIWRSADRIPTGFENLYGLRDKGVREIEIVGADEVEIVRGCVVLREFAVLAALEQPDRQVESRRTVLALVVAVRRKVVNNR